LGDRLSSDVDRPFDQAAINGHEELERLPNFSGSASHHRKIDRLASVGWNNDW